MKNNRKGSSAVFLTMILAALMTITLAMVYSVKENAVAGIADGITELACDSVMSEFDHKIQKDYGLFLIRGTDRELTAKINSYIDYSFDSLKNVEKGKVRVTASRFPVTDTELIRKQLLEHVKFMEIHDLIKKEENEGGSSMQDRKLLHGPTVASLPSAQVPEKSLTALAGSIGENISDVKEAFREGSEKYLINRYILSYFNRRTHAVSEKHFFKNEVEYILGGKMTDRKNERKVKIALEALRFPANLAHIYQDPE